MDFINFQSQMSMGDTISDPYLSTTRKTLDPIHNFIFFDNDIWKFIDTPEFQRLREVKQLGGVTYVFQGATHTRFEHCLGTGYLAQKLVKNIYKAQSDIVSSFDSGENSEQIKKNITLAGLLHDLGHGPFSHLFDGTVIPMLAPNSDWSHEKGSTMLLEKLVNDNYIDIEQENVNMISNLILGNKCGTKYIDYEWIFDIVANKRNSIDVDKYDYMTRDSYHLGLKDTYFDYRSLIKESRVINNEICFPAKLCYKVYELFQARYKLFKSIYHHRAASAVELMIGEVFLNANSKYHFEEAVQDPAKYMQLTDHILKEIEFSTEPELETSRKLIHRLRTRQIYKFASETIVDYHQKLPDLERMKADIVSYAPKDGINNISIKDIDIVTGTCNYAFKDRNPVDCVRFYNKNNIKKSFLIDKEQVSLLLPSKYCEKFIRIYVKDEKFLNAAKEGFKNYCKKDLNVSPGPIESKGYQETPQKSNRSTDFGNLLHPDSGAKKRLFTESNQSKPPTPSESFGFPGSQQSSA